MSLLGTFFDMFSAFRKNAINSQFVFSSSIGSQIGELASDQARSLAAVYAAVHAYSDSISTTPIEIVSDDEPQTDHSLWSLFNYEMNTDQTPQQAIAYMVDSLFLRGNAYGQIVRANGIPVGIVPHNPTNITPKRNGTSLQYNIAGSNPIPSYDMIHVYLNYSMKHLRGISPISYAQKSILLGLALDDYGLSFFRNGGQGRTILESPGIVTKKQSEDIIKEWEDRAVGSEGSNKTILLAGGLKANRLSLAPEDSQFLQSRKFTVGEVARWFNLPASRIGGERSSGTYANMEQDNLALVVHSLRPVCRMFEQEFSRKLLDYDERKKIKIRFDLDEMLISLGTKNEASNDVIQEAEATKNE